MSIGLAVVGDRGRCAHNGGVLDAKAFQNVRGGPAHKPIVATDILGDFDEGREDLPHELDVLGLRDGFRGHLHGEE